MRFLILGGDGFIGSHLATALKQDNDVYVLDREDLRSSRNGILGLKYINMDIQGSAQLDAAISVIKPDFVFNCVAIATPHYYVTNPHDTFDLDFTINYDIIKTLNQHKIPYMHFSTSEVYGKTWKEPYNEDTTDLVLGPTHKSRWIYAASKILLEQLILSGEHKDFCIIRPQNFCGWDMDWLPDIDTNVNKKWKPRLPACMLNNLITGKPLHVVLPGTQKRCYTHINDGVNGILAIIENWDRCKEQVFNIGNSQNEEEITSIAVMLENKWNEITNEGREKNIEFVK